MGASDKICREIGKVAAGIVLLIGGLVLLGWNEKKTVWASQTISKANDEMVQLDGCTPDPQYNNRLVAVMGCEISPAYDLTYSTMLAGIDDSVVSSDSFSQVFAWKRKAEQYVFHEESTSSSSGKKKKKKTTTTYSYEAAWVSSEETWSNVNAVHDCSDDLKVPCTKATWPSGNVMAASGTSPKICCGSATCSNTGNNNNSYVFDRRNGAWSIDIMSDFGNPQTVHLPQDFWGNSSSTSFGSGKALNCGDYLRTTMGTTNCNDLSVTTGNLPSSTNPYGTVKWSFEVRLKNDATQTLSGLALQYVDTYGQFTFKEWVNPDHSDCSSCKIGSFFNGDKTGEDILDDIATSNKKLTWLFRVLGWCLLWGAYFLCVSPIAAVPDLIPVFGKCMKGILGVVLCGVTCLVATSVTMFVIAIAWLAYRPTIGIPLMIGVVIFAFGICGFFYHRRQKQAQQMQNGQGGGYQQHYDQPGAGYSPGGHDMQAYPPPQGQFPPADPGYGAPSPFNSGYGAPNPHDGGYGAPSPGYAPPTNPGYPPTGYPPASQPEV